ncbi:MAG: PorT family protein [Saprospiraceae bacterium]|nr:PorT family protein [Saprospiraceae bacterium]
MKTQYANIAVLMVLALLLLPLVAQSQAKIGIRAGLNVSNISFDGLPNKSEKFGYHAGIFADLPVVSNFMSVQPELSYSLKGADFEPLGERQTLELNYVDFFLPVAFKLGSVDVQLGPFASYLISTPDYKVYNENTVVVDAFNKFDAGLTGGLSFNFNKFLIGIRYNQGFLNVTEENAKPFLSEGKNSVGQVSLGYRF